MGRFRLLLKTLPKISSLVFSATSILMTSAALSLVACSSDDSTSPRLSYTPTAFTKEFLLNYELLKYLYIDQETYLEKPEVYINRVDVQKLVDEGYPWDYHDIYYLYGKMNDPFTYYIDPSRSSEMLRSWRMSDTKMDAGLVLDSTFLPQKYVVGSVAKNSPIDKAGIKPGDEITEIEGIALTNKVLYDRLSSVYEGDTITYTIKRDTATFTIPVEIVPYLSPTVELTFKDSIPVIKINEFTAITSNDSGTYGEFLAYLHETEKYKTTIIDLRNNGGGEIGQCLPMAQELLSKGDTAMGFIYAYKDSVHQRQAFDTVFFINEANGIAKDRYFTILANGRTASCSELMIAAITAYKKVPVVGTTTYGKGIGQKHDFTPSLSIYSITNMKVIDKNGVSYHRYGIAPDFTIQDDDFALNKALALAKEQSYVRVAGYGTENTGHFAKSAVEPDTMPGFSYYPGDKNSKIKFRY